MLKQEFVFKRLSKLREEKRQPYLTPERHRELNIGIKLLKEILQIRR